MQHSQSPRLSQSIQGYAKIMVDEMAINMRNLDPDGKIAVTTFVRVDSDLTQSSTLSFELAEAFMSELHRFGLTTVDFKAADYIRVTEQGDFVMTRDYLELKESISATYALLGTYLVQHNGISVHARIVELSSQTVLATGETTIPPEYLQYVLRHPKNSGAHYES
ncbi:FlgO family outer membrane protein [Alteromonas gilva]|uniref:FlgO family outer membrane protein n=1 Tax=Alteromonas gilva TaxID=2987522 RepID=A0ABT5KYB8_9ALTE|nr:FlgO family outer membrane protein [Alteromonas gilva]MDC8829767.1 FlgO family outer membrane protein [Alteromonas gilva]